METFILAHRRTPPKKHKRIKNYVSNVVLQYLEVDFIMHFRFPRVKVAFLSKRFEMSPLYQKLLSKLFCHVTFIILVIQEVVLKTNIFNCPFQKLQGVIKLAQQNIF